MLKKQSISAPKFFPIKFNDEWMKNLVTIDVMVKQSSESDGSALRVNVMLKPLDCHISRLDIFFIFI